MCRTKHKVIFTINNYHMQHEPKHEGNKPLFSNPLLEKLARTHIAVPLSIYFIGSAILLYVGFGQHLFSIAGGLTAFFSGLIFWTFFEYLAHKHIFHMLPTNKVKERIQYTFHGVHHEYPRDKERFAMPPAASVLILTAIFFILQLVMGNYAYAFLPGFVIGYSLYLFVHYSVHAFRPPRNFLKVLWINHSIHHYKDDTVAFGVSTPLWDYIMGTLPEKTYERKRPKADANDRQSSGKEMNKGHKYSMQE